ALVDEEMMMSERECNAVEHGDVEYLLVCAHAADTGHGPKYFSCKRDSERKNYLHKFFLIKWGNVVITWRFIEFIEMIINEDMMKQTDINGDTPLHILAQLEPHNIKIRVFTLDEDFTRLEEECEDIGDERLCAQSSDRYLDNYVWTYLSKTSLLSNLIEICAAKLVENNSNGPLVMQNLKGNTPFHEAIISKNYQVMIKLAELSRDVALVNNCNETVLHLLATLIPTPSIADDILGDIIKNNMKDGSLLVNVILAGNMEFAEKLITLCPKLVEVMDNHINDNGQTFWHLLVNESPIVARSFNLENSSFTKEPMLSVLENKDNNGKTALHLAVERRRFDLAELLLGLDGTLTSEGTPIFLDHLLKIPNNDGITPTDLIGELAYVPPQVTHHASFHYFYSVVDLDFEDFMGKVSTMIGIRSIWGIPSTQIKDYVNTMGVIAALLTTITFTAAFAVPGGLDQDTGAPLLLHDTSFQIFIVSDILAMCLSMMVLFCLLWIMATGNKSNTVVLLDFSIILLLASFYTTLVTFMTGLYATTYHAKPWVAIFSLVMCLMLLVLMHKYLVIKFIIPSGKVMLIYFDKAFQNARKFCKKLIRQKKNGRRWRSPPRSELPISTANETSQES
ncbi:Ankyrin repeat-containing protein ITN1, partial [Bienertia sinuspersici]